MKDVPITSKQNNNVQLDFITTSTTELFLLLLNIVQASSMSKATLWNIT
jgi:hypothetical protein